LRHSFDYKIGKYKLTINIWFLVIFLLVQMGLNELGYWQLSRAKEKQQRIEILSKEQVISNHLGDIDSQLIANFSHVQIESELALRKSFLIENTIQNGELGYHVLNLVKDKVSDRIVLVNRGWIAGKANRNEIPQIELPPSFWSIKGRVYPINSQVLSDKAEIESFGNVVRVPVLDSYIVKKLEERFHIEIEPFIIRLEKENASSFDVDWEWLNMSPEKHLGYAFQWFALSLTFLIVSLFALIKKDKNSSQ